MNAALVLKIALLIILAYLLGSFPTGYLVGKAFFHQDIRKLGSGNTGATNAFRCFGPWPGLVVLAVDVLKGTLASLLPVIFHLGLPHYWVLIFGIAAIAGHTFSIFLKFHGGKAVATSAGILLGYNPAFFGCCAAIFIPIVLISSTVSFSSLTTVVLAFIVSFWFHDWVLTIVMLGIMILLFIRHHANINRLEHRRESIMPFGLLYWYRKKHPRDRQKHKNEK